MMLENTFLAYTQLQLNENCKFLEISACLAMKG